MTPANQQSAAPTRREFLRASSVAAVGGALAGTLGLVRGAHAAGSDVLKVGLIGCGGRGTGAASQALNADAHVQLTALGDAFSDRLQGSLATLKRELGDKAAEKIAVPPERCFVGFDAYKHVIDSGVDVVLLTSPPHFRPAHLKYAVECGKHVFAEKPVAVDAPGIRSVLATCEEAAKKNLSIVSGLCYRYEQAKRETIQRVQDGTIGKILAMHVSYNTGTLWHHNRQPQWSEMEFQLRNWLYFTWLSGDHNCEQHVHSLDKAAWAMQDEPPVAASGIGGRQVRVEEQWGNVYDHFSVVYEYAGGAKLFANCRQMAGCAVDVSDHFIGTEGSCQLMKHAIESKNAWRYQGPKANMYQQEHDELFAAIRAGKPINNGVYMSRSSMMAILGRMAAYTGQRVTWEQALASQEDMTPTKYEWGDVPMTPVAKPGITKVV